MMMEEVGLAGLAAIGSNAIIDRKPLGPTFPPSSPSFFLPFLMAANPDGEKSRRSYVTDGVFGQA